MAFHRISSSLLVLAATGALLTGCGGSDSPTPAASTSNITPSTTVGAIGYLYGSVNVVNSANETTGQRIALVDAGTGTLVKGINVDAGSTQMTAQAFTVLANGLGTQAGKDTALYYTNGGKLFKVDLTQAISAGADVRVSAETAICKLVKVLPKDTTATSNWVVVGTAGMDGDCGTTADNELKLIASSNSDTAAASASAAATTLPFKEAQVLNIQRNAQGQLDSVVGYVTESALQVVPDPDSTTGGTITIEKITKLKLVAVSATTGAQSELNVPAITPTGSNTSQIPSVAFFSKVAGSASDIYLQVGDAVRKLTLDSTGKPSLGTAVAGLSVGTPAFVHTDAQATYVVDYSATPAEGTNKPDGTKFIKALAADGSVKSLGTIDKDTEVLSGSAMTDSSLLLVLRDKDGKFSLRAVNKNGGAKKDVITASSSSLKVEAVNGDTAVVSQSATADTGAALLSVTATASGITEPVVTSTAVPNATKARVITVVGSGLATLAGETQHSHVVWCDATTACKAANVSSYKLQGGTNLLLAGAATTSPAWDGTRAVARNVPQGLLSAQSHTNSANGDPILSTDSLWLFDASKAGSLASIATTSGQ